MGSGKDRLIKAKAVFLFLALSFIFTLPLAYGNEMVTVNKGFNGREIKVRVGSTIRVELEQAGPAGYLWEIENLDKEHFDVLSVTTPEPPDTGDFAGAPIRKTWLIRAKTKGKSALKFIHYRPWERVEQAVDTFFITVRIL